MKRIVIPKTSRTIFDWVNTQTYHQHDKEKSVVIKEFFKFDGETPVDRIFVSYVQELPISDKTIIKCLDDVLNNWLQCCFIDNSGKTHTIISSYEHIITKNGLEESLTFGNQYYLK